MASFTRSFILLLIILSTGTLLGTRSNDKTARMQECGHLYLCGTYWHYSSHHFWNSKGHKKDAFNTFKKDEVQAYAEYGITWCDTLSIKEGYGRVDESLNGKTIGFTDIEIGWKRFLGQKWKTLFATELVGIIPIETQHKSGLRYGRYGVEINMIATKGFSLLQRCGWCDFRLGYRTYEGFPSDQIRADVVGTFELFPRTRLVLGGYLEYGLFNGHSVTDQSLFCLHSNYRLFKGRAELQFDIYKGAGIFVGYQHNIWGNNVGTNGGWYGGAQIQF